MKKTLLLTLFTLSTAISFAQVNVNNIRSDAQKFTQVLNYFDQLYVDTINTSALTEKAIESAISQLDPHSAYVSAKEMKSIEESFKGNFEGVGIEFSILHDTLMVVNPIAGGPSDKVGIMSNDKIVKINGKNVIGIKENEVPGLLRGPKGSKIIVEVVRRGVKNNMEFLIIRDKIPMHTLDAAYMVNDKIGYIKLNRFAATTTQEFIEALYKLNNPENLILDLRGNGGGFLDQAIKLTSQFIEPQKLVVSTQGRNVRSERMYSDPKGVYRNGGLAILIDGSSASASEIVSGAIQDWDRGVIVGSKSFGKGLVQKQIPLFDGSALRITTSRYLTPTGRAIQRPFENGKAQDYYKELATRDLSDSAQRTNSDTTVYRTLKKGRPVYGGGGITPDYITHDDTTGFTAYWGNIIRSGAVNEYVIDYMDKNRKQLTKSYPTVESYIKNFTVTDNMLADMSAIGTKRNVKPNAEELSKSSTNIKAQIKALIAQKLWGTSEYFQIMNTNNDSAFKKAVELLTSK